MKKIIFLIGVYGSGKTATLKRLERQFKNQGIYLCEDDSMLFFLSNRDIYIRHQFYLYAMYYRIHKGIDDLFKKDASFLVIDGHPLLNLAYGQSFLELQNTSNYSELTKISKHELTMISKFHQQMQDFANIKRMYEDLEQILVYINLPFDVNAKLVNKRGRGTIWGVVGTDFLITLRKVLHSKIYQSVKDARIVEINSLEELESFDPNIL